MQVCCLVVDANQQSLDSAPVLLEREGAAVVGVIKVLMGSAAD